MSIEERLKRVIKKSAEGVLNGSVPAETTYLELISIEPLRFRRESGLIIESAFIVTPKHKVFIDDDIGRKFVFQKNAGGQTYFYSYEPAPQGENGVPYEWEGHIVKCNLIGTCPDGTVVVTHGTIEHAVHERRKA